MHTASAQGMQTAQEYINNDNLPSAIKTYETLVQDIDIAEYILDKPSSDLSKRNLKLALYNLGTLYKLLFQAQSVYSRYSDALFLKAVSKFIQLKSLDYSYENLDIQMEAMYSHQCVLLQSNPGLCKEYLEEILEELPESGVLNYNMGLILSKLGLVHRAVFHYKLATKSESTRNVASLNLGQLYHSLGKYTYSLQTLINTEFKLDPDINNTLGYVYMSVRNTRAARRCFELAKAHVTESTITVDKKRLLAEIYLNYGSLESYIGDNQAALEKYNKALEVVPGYKLAFQNKLMGLLYTDTDETFISAQHALADKILGPLTKSDRTASYMPRNPSDIVVVGFVSGDFIDHPVSAFLAAFLKCHDKKKFKVLLFSESITPEPEKYITIKGKSDTEVIELVKSHNVDILVDLSGHTSKNRLGVFAKRAARVQVTYLGYPYTTGLKNMDYRLTDSVCDDDKSQKMYSEKLVYFTNCFLCYTPQVPLSELPISESEALVLGGQRGSATPPRLVFGCFNKLNKMSPRFIKLVNRLTSECNVRFVIKTKSEPPGSFKESLPGVEFIQSTVTYKSHLLCYNTIDYTLDTFPYSGTTTSCESLLMGTPVFTSPTPSGTKKYHPQNVTSSILKNSDLGDFVYTDQDKFIEKVKTLTRPDKTLTRKKFLEGNVCNQMQHTRDLERILKSL